MGNNFQSFDSSSKGYLLFKVKMNIYLYREALSLYVVGGIRLLMGLKEMCLYIHCVLCKSGLCSSLDRDFSIIMK